MGIKNQEKLTCLFCGQKGKKVCFKLPQAMTECGLEIFDVDLSLQVNTVKDTTSLTGVSKSDLT